MGVNTDNRVDATGESQPRYPLSSTRASEEGDSEKRSLREAGSIQRPAERKGDETNSPLLIDFTIEDDVLADDCSFRERAELHFEFQRIVPIDSGPLPLLWVGNAKSEPASVLDESKAVHSADPIAQTSDRTLYEVQWRKSFLRWFTSLYAQGMYLISLESEPGSVHWTCVAWVRNQQKLPDFYENITSKNLDITINELTRLDTVPH